MTRVSSRHAHAESVGHSVRQLWFTIGVQHLPVKRPSRVRRPSTVLEGESEEEMEISLRHSLTRGTRVSAYFPPGALQQWGDSALKHLQRWIWKGLLVAAALLGGAGLVRLLLQG